MQSIRNGGSPSPNAIVLNDTNSYSVEQIKFSDSKSSRIFFGKEIRLPKPTYSEKDHQP